MVDLHALFVDPRTEEGRGQVYRGVDHNRPPATLVYLAMTGDHTVRPGTYALTGEQFDGHWVYRRHEDN